MNISLNASETIVKYVDKAENKSKRKHDESEFGDDNSWTNR